MDSWTWVIVAVAVVAAALLGAAVWLLLRLVRTRRELRRAGLPTGPKWVFWGAVLYLVLPTDLVPDPVYLDDIGVLLLAIRSMRSGRQDALAAMGRQEGTGTALRG
ncbi:YkvA family protein [Streptomyces sp. 11x1]|uniref:YkvA family protein n=1 Tax=Streptomyces sp. 11x1 TaxID=3038642 RepID=UPI00160BC9FB|nr:YkvA family protein [Streptomyces sp. 11x1]WNZ06859.1 YkvA family protein [Streptomyces sp. 11x1]